MSTIELAYCKYDVLSAINISWFYWIQSCMYHSCCCYWIP